MAIAENKVMEKILTIKLFTREKIASSAFGHSQIARLENVHRQPLGF
jgi:hypothetical protein